jgi:hypothetical protein
LVKPGGGIFCYDFAFNNPSNPDVLKVTRAEVKALFPEARADIERLTLAPPIARQLALIGAAALPHGECLSVHRGRICWDGVINASAKMRRQLRRIRQRRNSPVERAAAKRNIRSGNVNRGSSALSTGECGHKHRRRQHGTTVRAGPCPSGPRDKPAKSFNCLSCRPDRDDAETARNGAANGSRRLILR